MYQQAVTDLIAAADVAAQYRNDLAAFADTLGGKRWGVEVTGPIADVNSELVALEGEYRDLAGQMRHQGDQGADAHEQAPWVPHNLLAEECSTVDVSGSPIMADAIEPERSANDPIDEPAAIAAKLRTIETVDEGGAYLDAQHLDKEGLLAVAGQLWELRNADRRLSRKALKEKLVHMAIGARRKREGLRKW